MLVDSSKEATDNAISSTSLFKVSYNFQGKAFWLTGYQSALADPQNLGLGVSLLPLAASPESVLFMQMVRVDSVTLCGSRLFGWTDTDSALMTLVCWLYLSGITKDKQVQLNDRRVKQFAKTVLGGMCRCGDSYQEPDEDTLGPLEDWLHQSLVDSSKSDLPDPDGNYDDSFAENWMPPASMFGNDFNDCPYQGGDTGVRLEAWIRKSLVARVCPAGSWAWCPRMLQLTFGRDSTYLRALYSKI